MKTQLSILLLLLTGACGDGGKATEEGLAAFEEEAGQRAAIACAVDGAASVTSDCTMERVSGPEGTTLTVRHPSGAFGGFSSPPTDAGS
jgi:hypothetical protein